MLIVISPAKTLDYETPATTKKHTQPRMLAQSEKLIEELLTYSPDDISSLMKISDKLAQLNVERYQHWSRPFKASNAKQSVLAFQGDVYQGLEADKFTEKQFGYAQDHLRILSGLYGVLRPLDLMQAYRLEMGTKLSVGDAQNLYQFWDLAITKQINKDLQAIDSKILINLASQEYFKSVKPEKLDATVIEPVFKDYKNGNYKVISFFAKKARGTMAAWLLKNQVKTLAKLKKFSEDGYQFSEAESSEDKVVFLRKTN